MGLCLVWHAICTPAHYVLLHMRPEVSVLQVKVEALATWKCQLDLCLLHQLPPFIKLWDEADMCMGEEEEAAMIPHHEPGCPGDAGGLHCADIMA